MTREILERDAAGKPIVVAWHSGLPDLAARVNVRFLDAVRAAQVRESLVWR